MLTMFTTSSQGNKFMIYSVTLNPAIDRTIFVDEINFKDVTRVSNTIRQAAGKGINISFVMQKLGKKAVSVNILAGENGEYILRELKGNSVDNINHLVTGNTRENIKVVPKNGSVLEINESGPVCSSDDVKIVIDLLKEYVTTGDIVVLTGSIPKGLHATTYHDMIKDLKGLGVITVLDASGDSFKEAVKAKPTVIKPNLYELGLLFDKELTSKEEVLLYAKKLVSDGIEQVLITLGGDGALLVTKEKTYYVNPIKVDAINTVGAGDSFLAGYVAALSDGLSKEECLKKAASVATSSVLNKGTGPSDLSHIEELERKVEVILL